MPRTSRPSPTPRQPDADVLDIRTPGLVEALGEVDRLSIWELLRRFGRPASVDDLMQASGWQRPRVQVALDALSAPGNLLVERVPAARGRRVPHWRTTRETIVVGFRLEDARDESLRASMSRIFGEERRREVRTHAKAFAERVPGEFFYNTLHAGAFTREELRRIWEILQELERLFHTSNARFHEIDPADPQWCTYHLTIDVEPLRKGILPLPMLQVIAQQWSKDAAGSYDTRLAALSKREREVAFHVRDGLNQRQIAEVLGISYHSVVTLRRRLYAKLGISSRDALRRILAAAGSGGGSGAE
jgi:DNA-binding CsgD family transcriptional regulator